MRLDVHGSQVKASAGSTVLLLEWAMMVSPKALHLLHKGFVDLPWF